MKIGTRKSTMALAQTNDVADQVAALSDQTRPHVVEFQTRGDKDQVSKLGRHGGKGGAFVAEIRNAVLQGELDAAMHSLKDMPGDEEAPGLVIGTYTKREDPLDALVLRKDLSMESFKANYKKLKIGTNSVRRKALILKLFPGAEVIHFRGAADTRIHKLDNGILQETEAGEQVGPADALIMAAAGLRRVGLGDRISYVFSASEMLPAVGQGIVAVECGEHSWATRSILDRISDPISTLCALAEREMLWFLNGHCNSPIAGHAIIDGSDIHLAGSVMSLDGKTVLSHEARGPSDRPRELGREVANALIDKGAAEIIEQARE